MLRSAPMRDKAVKIYYSGERRYRSPFVFVVMCLIGFVAISLISSLVSYPGWVERSLGLAIAVLVVTRAWPWIVGFVRNELDVFAIRSDGIYRRGRLVPWRRIRQLGAFGAPGAKSVSLFYSKWPWRSCPPLLHELRDSRRVSPADFEELSATLQRELGDRYPALEIGHYVDLTDG